MSKILPDIGVKFEEYFEDGCEGEHDFWVKGRILGYDMLRILFLFMLLEFVILLVMLLLMIVVLLVLVLVFYLKAALLLVGLIIIRKYMHILNYLGYFYYFIFILYCLPLFILS